MAVVVTSHRRVTLDNPQMGNRLTARTVDNILRELDDAEAGADVFVIAADGGIFCTGMDLGDPQAACWRPDPAPVQRLLTRLADTPLVTVALVNGLATGGGVGLAAACDILLAGPQARFRLTETLLGFVPALIFPALADRIGAHRAFSLALRAREVGPEEALATGLADRYGPDPEGLVRDLLSCLPDGRPARHRGALLPRPRGWEELSDAINTTCMTDPNIRERLRHLLREGAA
ncbi:enoyl-CoA hydratase-related protein [Streptomyces sp. NPDC001139]